MYILYYNSRRNGIGSGHIRPMTKHMLEFWSNIALHCNESVWIVPGTVSPNGE